MNINVNGAAPSPGEPRPPDPPKPAKYVITSAAELAKPLPPVEWVCKGLRLPRGALVIVGGYGYSRKTMFAQEVALSVATGKAICGLFSVEHGPALHIDCEQGRYITPDRYQRLAFSKDVDLAGAALSTIFFPGFKLTDTDARDLLRQIFGQVKPRVAVIDSLKTACVGVDENDSRIREPLDVLGEVAKEFSVCAILIHHAKKPQKGESVDKYSLRGSSAIFDALDGAFVFSGEKGQPTTVTHEKDRFLGNELPSFGLDSVDVQAGDDPRAGLRLLHLEGEEMSERATEAEAAKVDQETQRAAAAIEKAFVKAGGNIKGSKDVVQLASGIRAQAFRGAFAVLESAGALTNEGTYHKPVWRWIGRAT